MAAESPFELEDYRVHSNAEVATDPAFSITTPAAPWSYAVSFPKREVPQATGLWLVTVAIDAVDGEVGVGVLSADGTSFVKETLVRGESSVTFRIPADQSATGALVIRNGSGSRPARVSVRGLTTTWLAQNAPLYLVDVSPRQMSSERAPADGGTIVFDDHSAAAINDARLDWLQRLGLDLQGRRVLDVGAGVGHFSRYYADRGAVVTAIEGRAENVAIARARHPDVDAHTIDVQADDISRFGSFDIVHCFGLLYHLDSPVIALRRMHAVCQGMMLLETMVCDAARPLMMLADETYTVNQALAGLGCRPSPTFVVLALNRVGFPYVYGAQVPPAHQDFQFEFRDSGDTVRDGHSLRCVFVASRHELANPGLIPLL